METGKFLEKIQGVFPRVSIKDTTVETWQEILEHLDFETCNKAYIKYLKSGESREPKPGDILSIGNNIFKPREVKQTACEYCHGSGIIMLLDSKGHESIARCWCHNGERQPHFKLLKMDFVQQDPCGRILFLNG